MAAPPRNGRSTSVPRPGQRARPGSLRCSTTRSRPSSAVVQEARWSPRGAAVAGSAVGGLGGGWPPSGRVLPFLQALTRLEERARIEGARSKNRDGPRSGRHAARRVADARARELDRRALEQDCRPRRRHWTAVEQACGTSTEDLREAQRNDPPMRAASRTGSGSVARADHARRRSEPRGRASMPARQHSRATCRGRSSTSLRASVGDSVEDAAAPDRRGAGGTRSRTTSGRAGGAKGRGADPRRRAAQEAASKAEKRARRARGDAAVGAITSLVASAAVPGMLDAAGVERRTAGVVRDSAGPPCGEPVGRDPLLDGGATGRNQSRGGRRRCAHQGVAGPQRGGQSGPAADHQPTVAEFGDLFAVSRPGRWGRGPSSPVSPIASVRVWSGTGTC